MESGYERRESVPEVHCPGASQDKPRHWRPCKSSGLSDFESGAQPQTSLQTGSWFELEHKIKPVDAPECFSPAPPSTEPKETAFFSPPG